MKPRLLTLLFLFVPALAAAHKFDSAFLGITERGSGLIEVRLKLPLAGGRAAAVLDVRFPASCQPVGMARTRRTEQYAIRNWNLSCAGGLRDGKVSITGLNPMVPGAVAALRFSDGSERILLLDPGNADFVFQRGASRRSARLGAYFPLGIGHILGGADHLLFVAGLLLVVYRGGARIGALVGTVTAFTLAHSLTLAAAVLGHASLPSSPVEAVIALSILLLAVELAVAHGQTGPARSLTFRKPWLVAFGFGLVHGFGFAGALREVGLPEHAVGWALLLFNLGVEAGQLLFVAALLTTAWLLTHARPVVIYRSQQLLIFAMGVTSAYWVIARVAPAIVLEL